MKKVILLSLLLGGCMTDQNQQIARDDTQCLSYGVTKGSPEYVACRSRLDQQRSDRKAAASFGQSGGLVGAVERASDR
jgi:hypothetical protein